MIRCNGRKFQVKIGCNNFVTFINIVSDMRDIPQNSRLVIGQMTDFLLSHWLLLAIHPTLVKVLL